MKSAPGILGKVESGQHVYRHDVDTLILKGGADAKLWATKLSTFSITD